MEKNEINKQNDLLIKHILSLTEKENWKSSLKKTEKSLQIFEEESWLSTVDTIYIVGHGTSLATALVAESWFGHISKLNARALPAFYFNSYVDDFLINPERTLVIGISCAGNTASVIQSLENANKVGAITLCLSGEDETACAKVAKYRIITDAHKDKHIKVSAYSISHIYLLIGAYRLAVQLGKMNRNLTLPQVNYWQKQLENGLSTLKELPNIYDQMDKICEKILEIGGDNFAVVGTGPNFGTMKEGALKISEFCWKFGAGEELEDFAHGRFREIDSSIPLLIISPSGKPSEKTLDLLAGCVVSKTPTIVFTDNKTLPMEKLATHIVDMPRVYDEYLTPFLYIFPLWFYGYHIRQKAGKLVGEVRHNLKAVDINFKANFDALGDKIT